MLSVDVTRPLRNGSAKACSVVLSGAFQLGFVHGHGDSIWLLVHLAWKLRRSLIFINWIGKMQAERRGRGYSEEFLCNSFLYFKFLLSLTLSAKYFFQDWACPWVLFLLEMIFSFLLFSFACVNFPLNTQTLPFSNIFFYIPEQCEKAELWK